MSWPTAKLGDVADFVNGAAFKPTDWGEAGRRIIRIQNLTDPEKPYNRTLRVVPDKLVVRTGDLLVSWSATLGVFTWNHADDAVLNQHIFRVQHREHLVDQSYLRHMLADALRSMGSHLHGATMQHVNRGAFLATEIPLPPLPEQRRIASILDQADALRERNRRLLTSIANLADASFDEVVSRSEPSSHGAVALSDIYSVAGGKRLPKGVPYSDEPTHHPYLRVSDMQNGTFRTHGLKFLTPQVQVAIKRYTVDRADLVVSIAGTIGLVATVPPDLNGANLTENAARLRPKDPGRVISTFMRYQLSAPAVQSQIRAATGQVTIGKLALFRIEALRIHVPSMDVQTAFTRRIEEIDRLADSQSLHLAKLDELFASLQHRAFRGEL